MGKTTDLAASAATIAAEYRDGASLNQLMIRWRTSARRLRPLLVSQGLAIRPSSKHSRPTRLEALAPLLVAAYAAGSSLPTLARKYVASEAGIRTVLLRHGVTLRRAGDDWTDEQVETLRRLWPDQTVTIAAIGARLGKTKNGVAIKAHRLGLPRRRAPRKGAAVAPRPGSAPQPRPPVAAPPPPAPSRVVASLPPTACQWIAGAPRADDGCKCRAPVLPGRSYCAAHAKRAYLVKSEAA